MKCALQGRTSDHDRGQVQPLHAGIVNSNPSITVTAATNKASTRRCSTVALGGLITIAFKVVVELYLGAGSDVFGGEKPNLELALDHPLLCLGIRFTAMIDEACTVALATCINHLQHRVSCVDLNRWLEIAMYLK